MTMNLPISMKERNVSLFIYETMMSLLVIVMVSFSIFSSIIFLTQFEYLDLLIVNIFFVSTSIYLVLQLSSKLVSFICNLVNIPKLFHVINLSILFIIFTYFFREAQDLVTQLSQDYLGSTQKTESILLLWQKTLVEYGFLLTSLIYVGVTVVLIGLIIVIPDNTYMNSSKYVKSFHLTTNHLFLSYIYSSVRNINTVNTIVLTYLITIILLLFNFNDYLLYPIIFLSMNGLYSYIQSSSLRYVMYKLDYKVLRDYTYLFLSQWLIIVAVSIPILVVSVFVVGSVYHLFIPYLIVTSGVLLLILVGILFPPYNDNPFSVFTSFLFLLISVLTIGLTLVFLNLGQLLTVFIMIVFYSIVILFSIQGLINLQRSYKNEKSIFSI
ncbi:hypothetical protein [Caldalkalibacillus mannanilyticus]|uniref:hypothetical protein n=1 Tax=Caldalkalibacillus mannanilyticus TaxID=1418 RepID=UPI000468F0AA|nr:hypothetical protein [Caldalkalibacillus mannanilyticus]